MKTSKQKVNLTPLFIGVIREMMIVSFKMVVTAIVVWYVISGIVNNMPTVK